MSEETGRMSEEDKFLGVRTTIEPPESDNLEVEIVADAPVVSESGSNEHEELSQYSEKVQKRINKATARFRAEEKEKQEASKLAEEAVGYASNLKTENQRLVNLVQQSQKALDEQSTGRAGAALKISEENFKRAYESGDPDIIAQAQKDLTQAQMAEAYAPNYSKQIVESWQQDMIAHDRSQQKKQSEQPQIPEPDPRALAWQKENDTWFGRDKEMTSFAYGVHEKLTGEEGIAPDTDEYYARIDKRMKEVFPTQFGGNTTQATYSTGGTVDVDIGQRRRANPVVAPASRNTGATPRKVTLTETQVRLSKRLGLTPQQYATQLMKEQN